MIVNLDTNVLVRLLKQDDDRAQARRAMEAVAQAECIIVTVPALCEAAWILSVSYGLSRSQIADAFEQLLQTRRVRVDLAVVERGNQMLRTGGDFADGVITELGARLGAQVLLTFDKKARKKLEASGVRVQEPGASR